MFVVKGQHGTYRVQDDVLSKGGVGSIHRLVDDPDFVYKNYFSPAKAPSRDHLERLASVGREVLIRQGRRPGESPESSVNWPVDIALGEGDAVIGVVLPLIPASLFNEEHGGVRGLEFLVMARGNPPSAHGRIVLLLRMAEILAFVHSRGLVHGDVNGKNLAWTVQPQPVMYLIDCDGMVPQTPAPEEGVQALGWTDPRLLERKIKAHDHYSDWYALALAMYRGLLLTPGKIDAKRADGTWPEPSKIPADLPVPLADLIRRGLDPLDEHRRPAPSEWVEVLVKTYIPNNQFDTEAIRRLDAVSAPVKKFVPVPDVDYSTPKKPPLNGIPAPPVGYPAPSGPFPGPPVQPPRQPVPPVQPYRPAPGPPDLVQPYRPAPGPPVFIPRMPYPSRGPSGGMAQKALYASFGWYLKGVLACLVLPPLALIYVALTYLQMREVSSDYPGAGRTRLTLKIFAGISAVLTIIYALSYN